MKFSIQKREHPHKNKYKKEDLDIAVEFSKKMHAELGSFIKALVLFGSSARKENEKGDVDILVIVDDIGVIIGPDLAETYRIVTEKIILAVSTRLHVTSLKLTTFWEYARAGDPVAVNILRDGVALLDCGIFDPLQVLLLQGRMRPSPEAIWAYYDRAPRSIHNAKSRVLEATIDLYWACIDASHAALMKLGDVPPSPAHVAQMLDEQMVQKKLLDKKYALIMDKMFHVAKDIMHRETVYISGREFDNYCREATEFVKVMERFVLQK